MQYTQTKNEIHLQRMGTDARVGVDMALPQSSCQRCTSNVGPIITRSGNGIYVRSTTRCTTTWNQFSGIDSIVMGSQGLGKPTPPDS